MIAGFVDHRQACGLLGGISRQRLHTLQAEGRIGCVWVGGRRIYRTEAVLKLAKELKVSRQGTLRLSIGGEGEPE